MGQTISFYYRVHIKEDASIDDIEESFSTMINVESRSARFYDQYFDVVQKKAFDLDVTQSMSMKTIMNDMEANVDKIVKLRQRFDVNGVPMHIPWYCDVDVEEKPAVFGVDHVLVYPPHIDRKIYYFYVWAFDQISFEGNISALPFELKDTIFGHLKVTSMIDTIRETVVDFDLINIEYISVPFHMRINIDQIYECPQSWFMDVQAEHGTKYIFTHRSTDHDNITLSGGSILSLREYYHIEYWYEDLLCIAAHKDQIEVYCHWENIKNIEENYITVGTLTESDYRLPF